MKLILCVLVLCGCLFRSMAQKEGLIDTPAKLVGDVEFTFHEGYGDGGAPAIYHVVELFNLSETPIKDLDVTNRKGHLRFYVNGDTVHTSFIGYGYEAYGTDHLLKNGDSSRYSILWMFYKDATYAEKYGNEFNVHWTYRGLTSNKMRVNLKEKTAVDLDVELISSVDFIENEEYYQGPISPAIKFKIDVVNHASNGIPDLEVTNRSEHLTFFVNGREANPVSLYNGLERTDVDHKVMKGDTASYDVMWLLNEGNGIEEYYGNTFYVHWSYMTYESELYYVNLSEKHADLVPFVNLIELQKQYRVVLAQADEEFRTGDYQKAKSLYERTNSILPGDFYVRTQIKTCTEKLEK